MKSACDIAVRDYEQADTAALLDLMQSLAQFEGYIDEFAVTKAELIEHGLGPDALFHAFVAEKHGTLVGMAVTYIVPWTYTLRPRLVLKELYVAEQARGTGTGRALMAKVLDRAVALDADTVAWTVMDGNTAAEYFYRSLGGRPDQKWNNWKLCV